MKPTSRLAGVALDQGRNPEQSIDRWDGYLGWRGSNYSIPIAGSVHGKPSVRASFLNAPHNFVPVKFIGCSRQPQPGQASASFAAWIIIWTTSVILNFGFHPSFSAALEASPRPIMISVGRKSV